MTTKERALGRLFDITPVIMPADLVGGAKTGKRIHMKHGRTVTFVAVKSTDGGTTDDFALDVQEHTASTGGTSTDLDIVTDYFTKSETALDGDEAWVRTTQTAASEIAAITGTAELELVLVVEVQASDLSDGYEWISVNTPDLGSTDVQIGVVIAIISDLAAGRKPENLPDWLT
jgi:hypothetical protein